MNKIIKCLISFLLISAMVLSLSVCAFADGEQTNVKQFDNYCSIGDSVAYGIYYEDEPGIFPRLVKNAVGDTGEEHFFHHSGMRTKDFLVVLDLLYSGLTGEEIAQKDDYYSIDGGFNSRTLVNNKEAVQKMLTDADLITIELGLNDISYAPVVAAGLTTGEVSLEKINNFFSIAMEGFNSYSDNMSKIIEKIQQMKEGQDYTIVLVGVYNGYSQLYTTDKLKAPIGNLVSVMTNLLNVKCKSVAEKYGCMYADISNVETGAIASDMPLLDVIKASALESAIATHPSYPEGYGYIARQIIKQLPADEEKTDTNIRVDLGAITNIRSVFVDGVYIAPKYYSFDEDSRTLNIKYLLPTANTLTVSFDNNGAIGTAVYKLSFSFKDGYKAFLSYSNKNLLKSLDGELTFDCTLSVALRTRIKEILSK